MQIIQRFFCLVFLISFAITSTQAADIEGSSDHPQVGRFSGSEILGYHVSPYDEYTFPEGMIKDKVLSKSSDLEGKITRILYLAKAGVSTLEMYKNYENKLKKSGFAKVFSCKNKGDYGCGYDLLDYAPSFQPELIEYAYQARDHRYLSMKKTDSKGDVYVSMMFYVYKFDHFRNLFNHTMLQLDVIESKPLDDTQMEVVTAEKIASQVKEQGRIALYGIFFDTNKSSLKPESNVTLEQIIKALKSDTKLNLHVVGHTDNVGSFEHNMTLSRDRAQSVKTAIVYGGVNAGRLTANGVASLAPISNNQSGEGRAKNRRVELVAQ